MNKKLIISIFICILIIIIKYRFSNYTIEYKISDYDVKTIYKDKRLYYEIKDKNNNIYNFDIYVKKNPGKLKINKIKEIEGDNFSCIYPTIKNIETYPLCYQDKIYTDYNLIESDLLEEYKTEIISLEKPKEDFIYNNNLSKNVYVALWNYKGYIVMNDKNYYNVEIFKKDKYDNNLAYLKDNKIYMADYDSEHEYNKLIVLNLETLKTSEIELKYNIDHDSYFVGNIKNNLYIFDNKHSILYEINTKNNEINIKSNNEKGYVKYDGKKFVECSKKEYKTDKITYNVEDSKYIYKIENGLYKAIDDNKKLYQKINNDNIIKIKEEDNKLYYINKDNFMLYEPSKGNKKIFYNYEMTFNNSNVVFVYIDN